MIDKIEAYLKTSDPGTLVNKKPIYEKGPSDVKGYRKYKIKNITVIQKFTKLEFSPERTYEIKIRGSILKLIRKTNLRQNDLPTIKNAIVLLQRSTGLPIKDFIITKMEIGANMKMDKPIPYYLELLDHLSSAERNPHTDFTLYYNAGPRDIKFYDKGLHLKEKEPNKIGLYDDTENILRYEVTLNNLKSEFQSKYLKKREFYGIEFNVGHLLKRDIYNQLPEIWLHHYNRIHKKPRGSLKMTKPNDIIHSLALKGLKSEGGLDVLIKKLKDRALHGEIPEHYPTIILNKLKSFSKTYGRKNKLIRELDKKIEKTAINSKAIGP